jgi:ATP phosphoribosyltransferase
LEGGMMEDKKIVVSVRSVYGADKIYPACETAKLFADIAGTTTLREQDLRRIQKLGYHIVVSQPPPKWVYVDEE